MVSRRARPFLVFVCNYMESTFICNAMPPPGLDERTNGLADGRAGERAGERNRASLPACLPGSPVLRGLPYILRGGIIIKLIWIIIESRRRWQLSLLFPSLLFFFQSFFFLLHLEPPNVPRSERLGEDTKTSNTHKRATC